MTTCQVRWIDIDAYKHVNNTVFLRYLEQARLELFGHVPAVAGQPPPTGPDAEPTDSFVIAELEATYKRPLLLRPKPVYVHSWTTHLGNSSFHLTHALVDDQHEYLVGVARMVCINRESTRPRPLRAHEREILERYRMDPTARR